MGSNHTRSGPTVSWTALCCLLACAIVPVASAQYTPAFGPVQFDRTAGPPNQFVEQFQQCGTAGCQLVVVNGNADGSDRVSSAWIYLNGVEILGPSDFNQQTGTIITPVSLAASNKLEVKLASAPGSFLTVEVECVTSAATLSAVAPGDSLLNPSTLATALTFRNTGTGDAQNVSVSTITLSGGTLTSPTPLPFNLGTISAEGTAALYSDFSGIFAPSSPEVLAVSGTYTSGGASYCFNFTANFTIPKASPGSSPLHYVQATSNTVSGGGFPPGTVNANAGDNDSAGWTTPIGPISVATPPPPTPESTSPPAITSPETAILGITPSVAPLLSNSPVFYRNTDMYAGDFVFPQVPQIGQGCNYENTFGVCAEPSGAAEPGGTVFATSNGLLNASGFFQGLNAWSVDGIFGSATAPEPSFHPVNPSTVFPSAPVASQWPPPFCCDQVVQYAPSIGRFIWVMQLWNGVEGSGNVSGYRLAIASPSDIVTYAGTQWTYWDLPASLLASPFNVSNPSIDYPDLSIGNNYVYLSWDLFSGTNSYGHMVAQISLAQLLAGGNIQIALTDPADGGSSWGGHLSQDTLDAVYWAGHTDTSHLRVFSMKEGDNSYSWQDVSHPTYTMTGLSSKTPDSRDWMLKLSNFPVDAVIGATRVLGTPIVTGNGPPPETYDIWFAWSAGPIGTLPNPYIALVEVDQNSNFVLSGAIWNPDLAYGYPALATNLCTQEVGVSLVAGGNGSYEHHDVEFLDDSMMYATANSNVGVGRWGDYVTIRQAPPTALNPGNLFLAFGFGVSEPPPPLVGGVATSVRYVVFGRPSSSCTVIQ